MTALKAHVLNERVRRASCVVRRRSFRLSAGLGTVSAWDSDGGGLRGPKTMSNPFVGNSVEQTQVPGPSFGVVFLDTPNKGLREAKGL